MDFFLDCNVSDKLARMLDIFDRDNNVIHHNDRFDPSTPDTSWLETVSAFQPTPIIVSGDGRILRNPAERQVLQGLPLTFFVFASGWCNLPWAEQAWKAVKIWPEVVKAASVRQPTVFCIPIGAKKVDFIARTYELGHRRTRR